ncbi:MogA/MoaB family molybdenum cofactor biosynthesis protein [Staphylococcus pseudintermedius]|uniref:MogA/MoaB family molybdenum cofactor biosynthesis protein n=1 Tax=Staphylococcus pseudintermedius TaxID=283734 RepID=UPI001032FF7B|nr:molybdenum cofactor biosynthesis protein B [Staphylococcus pseudintermedius]EGQ0361783.1 molybdenum cofactor biosynthesis protein MoaB [Staphylococcus pseudintermedius]EGQ1294596.1 molybdenum cofactor biosynthesis protein [Staphylococcus pseudintermedius]EGQ1586921.1 molybdenum cofactor biosynthesis protein MoaB [Staphylococcus pseudintermedius]EGQ1755025.1 molybdenum cofactor biosynthesis protein MoaB [Staphylococcus pseudintermedius]EGQ1786985.1 molybdenum cofactor biosynthesis protein [S
MHTNVKLERPIRYAVLTVSDTRTTETDKGGQSVQTLLQTADFEVEIQHYMIVKDELTAIQSTVQQWLTGDVDVIVTTGGTGIAPRDVTIEAVTPLLDKEIEGFGELFRYLSFTEDVGTRALLSRAVAGTAKRTLIFCLPGSTGAVKLALNRLILPELTHLVYEMNK